MNYVIHAEKFFFVWVYPTENIDYIKIFTYYNFIFIYIHIFNFITV